MGLVALDVAGIPVNKYYACEIEKNAIKVSKKNYPDIISLGSVIDFKTISLGVGEQIDLLIGGSPCQDLSIASDDKSNNLSTIGKDNVVVKSPENEEPIIRKLTPIECERLQSLPDDYTSGIAMTNRYKCIGNAFNVEVVAHILKSIPPEKLLN